MYSYQEKLQGTPKDKKQIEKTEQASESDMAGILELSDWEFKTIINMLMVLMDKVDGMQEQMRLKS